MLGTSSNSCQYVSSCNTLVGTLNAPERPDQSPAKLALDNAISEASCARAAFSSASIDRTLTKSACACNCWRNGSSAPTNAFALGTNCPSASPRVGASGNGVDCGAAIL